jgi:membrane associated rhomboid family serine protease
MAHAPAFNLPPVIVWLTVALLAIHAVRLVLAPEAEAWLILGLAFIPARYGPLAEILPGGWGACIWSPATYALLHADWLHLAVNVIWMASFGSALARRFGGARFLLLALLAAVAGAGLHYVVHPGDEALMIGASGAVSGMMAATVRFAFAPGGPLAGGASPDCYRVPPVPLNGLISNSRALSFVLIWFAVNLLFGLGGSLIPGVAGPIAWQAHVGGFLAGLFAFPLLDPVRVNAPQLASRDPPGIE